MFLLSLFFAAAQSDPLAELSRRSAQLHSFTAVYELTSTTSPAATQLRIEFVAPARLRIDRTIEAQSTCMWSVDGVLAMSSRGGEKAVHGRADSAVAYAELAAFEKALHDAFPAARSRGPVEAAVGLNWTFDTKAQKAVFSIDAQLGSEFETPLGWLESLKSKNSQPREEGELLKFETDGAFQIAISKSTGFLEQFSGKSPNGEMHIALRSLEIDKAVDAARFTIAQPADGARDIGPDLVRLCQRTAQEELRRRVYGAVAGPDSPQVWDEAQVGKIKSVLVPFYAQVVNRILEAKLQNWRTIRDNLAKDVADMRKAGKSDEEIEQKRQRESGYLKKQLDELEQGFQNGLGLPDGAAKLPRAKELLAVEKQALLEAFRSSVRDPLLSQFETATGK